VRYLQLIPEGSRVQGFEDSSEMLKNYKKSSSVQGFKGSSDPP
jgi:hypothetical protein